MYSWRHQVQKSKLERVCEHSLRVCEYNLLKTLSMWMLCFCFCFFVVGSNLGNLQVARFAVFLSIIMLVRVVPPTMSHIEASAEALTGGLIG